MHPYSFLKNRKLIWLLPNQNVECRNQILRRFSLFNNFEWSDLKLTETALGTSFGWVQKSFGLVSELKITSLSKLLNSNYITMQVEVTITTKILLSNNLLQNSDFCTRKKDWSLQCARVWQRFLIPTQKRDQLATITITSVVEAFWNKWKPINKKLWK